MTNTETFLLALGAGAAFLAFWLVARFPDRAPANFRVAMIHVMASHQIPAEGRVPLHALTAPRSSLARAPMGRAAPNEHSTAKFHGVNQDRTR